MERCRTRKHFIPSDRPSLVDVWQERGGQPGERVCDAYVYFIDDCGMASWQGRYGTYIGRASVTHWMKIPGPPEV
jgi:hypothetical protein